MADEMDIDSGYDARDRELSPRRDYNRDEGRRDDFRRDRDERRRGGYRTDRSPRRRRDHDRDFALEELKDTNAPPGSRDSDRNYENSIFVGNLGYSVDSQRLRDMFASAGHIVRADVVTQGGRHRGMATVEFSNKDEVQRAISQFHQTRIDDREIFVRQDNPPPGARKERGDRYDDRRDRYGDREASYGRDRFNDRGYGRGDRYGGRDRYDDRRDYGRDRFGDRDTRPKLLNGPHYEVFVGNLPFSARWQDLKDLFKEVGDVIRADVKVDEYSGRSRGFGMVYFATQEDVQTAIERFNNYEMDGRRLDVRAGKKNSDTSPPERSGAPSNSEFTENVEGDGPQNDTIFVDNLPFATNNQDLIDLFGTIENVVKAEIIYTAGGRPAGCGVIQFESETAADAAIDKLNNYNYGGRDLKVSFAKRP